MAPEREDGVREVVRHEPRMSCGDFAAVRVAAAAGLGIALLPDHVCGEALGNGQLVRVLPDWSGQQGILHIVFTTRRGLPPSVRALIDHLACAPPRAISLPGLAGEASRWTVPPYSAGVGDRQPQSATPQSDTAGRDLIRWSKIVPFCFCLRCRLLALNRRPTHGQSRQVLGEDRSRQPVISAAVCDPFRHFGPLNCCCAK